MKRVPTLRILALAVLSLHVLFMSSCRAQKPTQSRESTNPIQCEAGRPFAIRLESNRTTGYQWDLAEPLDGRILKLANSEYKAPDSTRLGAPGEEVWTFQAVGKGRTKIAMKYARPWEKNAAPARTAVFDVTVREKKKRAGKP